MVDTENYIKWLTYAERDLKSLNESIKYKTSYNEDYCYKGHQIIEKLFKSYLIKKSYELKRTHDTFKLCRFCHVYNEIFKDFEDTCSFLDKFYIGSGYPQEDELIALDSDVDRITIFVNDVFKKIEPLIREEDKEKQTNIFNSIIRK